MSATSYRVEAYDTFYKGWRIQEEGVIHLEPNTVWSKEYYNNDATDWQIKYEHVRQ